MGVNMEISQKKERAIIALLTEPSIKDAALIAGVGETTLFRWLKQPDFLTAYREARKEVITQTISRVQKASGKAVSTLYDVMDHEEAPHSSKVSAAKIILDTTFKLYELEELSVRIENLEKQAKASL